MAIVASILLLASLYMSVMFGAQTRLWTWGPGLVPLGLALLSTLPIIWRGQGRLGYVLVTVGSLAIMWISCRALVSPVKEFAYTDMLLLASVVGAFLVMRIVTEDRAAFSIFLWGLAGLLLASVIIIGIQVADPTFSPVFSSRPADFPSGFYGHYNEGASFLLGASMLLAGAACFTNGRMSSRVIWGIVSIAGLTAVYFTRSRGAILAAGTGLIVFGLMSLLFAKTRGSRWFTPLAFALPITAAAVILVVVAAWFKTQEFRSQDASVSGLLDNQSRLSLLGIAASCIRLHPWVGGGSRSFSWECYQFWDIQQHGWHQVRPEMAHNELLQAITDYGLIGGASILIVLAVIVISSVLRTFAPGQSSKITHTSALHIGGIAALSALLVQASFSFIFHLLPGSILLALCLGQCCAANSLPISQPDRRAIYSRSIFSTCLILLAAAMIPFGVRSIALLQILWPIFYAPSGEITTTEQQHALSRAIALYPLPSFYKERALLHQRMTSEKFGDKSFALNAESAVSDYQSALILHPYDINLSINLANLLSLVGRDDEATLEYGRASYLQGGMELGFRAHLRASTHLLKVGTDHLRSERPIEAIRILELAIEEFDKASMGYQAPPLIGEGMSLKYSILENLGVAKASSGDIEGALATYNQLAELGNDRGRYRAGVVLGNLGKTAWSERNPSKALTLFQEAKEKITQAKEIPAGVTPEMKAEYLAFLDKSIRYLIEAKVEPLKKGEE